uniref:Uncharacterized protein n=1 Tax=Panagrolaimus davidi TaxID=227884 RepID=A0A914PJL7_9BILA
MNPLSPKIYQKLIQTCKYFFIKNPIIVFEKLFLDFKENIAHLNHFGKPFNMTNFTFKIWVINEFHNAARNTLLFHTSSMIRKIHRCDAKELYLSHQEISLNEFIFLSPNIKIISLNCTPVKNEDGTILPLEKLVTYLPNAINIRL